MNLSHHENDTAVGEVRAAVTLLRSTTAVRERSRQLLDRARDGMSPWFVLDEARLPAAAECVADTTRQRYPDLDIPFHSRWRHFEAGGVDRRAQLENTLGPSDPDDRARAFIDVALVSVLLDAGAGSAWRYREDDTDRSFRRSEGLGVASWHAFCAGLFSGDPDRPLQADAARLAALTVEDVATAFQVSADNPLVGLEGRVALLRNLGAALTARRDVFGAAARPGGLYDALTSDAGDCVAAQDILATLLDTLAPIWPADNTIGGQPVGDCWRHPAVHGPGRSDGWVPFHKLSQWLTYSLIEPFQWAEVAVTGLDELTGLPEYRNGGLLLDTGVLQLRDASLAEQQWRVGDEMIVEWRALTVALLDELADHVRDALDRDAEQLPLACVLEGGTWAAGRALADRTRDGRPPIAIVSDGTVF